MANSVTFKTADQVDFSHLVSFKTHHPDFHKILGANPTITLLLADATSTASFHEACICKSFLFLPAMYSVAARWIGLLSCMISF